MYLVAPSQNLPDSDLPYVLHYYNSTNLLLIYARSANCLQETKGWNLAVKAKLQFHSSVSFPTGVSPVTWKRDGPLNSPPFDSRVPLIKQKNWRSTLSLGANSLGSKKYTTHQTDHFL
ncbi:unnamed protein product [Caretta caretta]